eukprot:3940350-Rhodomonas_salina.2
MRKRLLYMMPCTGSARVSTANSAVLHLMYQHPRPPVLQYQPPQYRPVRFAYHKDSTVQGSVCTWNRHALREAGTGRLVADTGAVVGSIGRLVADTGGGSAG